MKQLITCGLITVTAAVLTACGGSNGGSLPPKTDDGWPTLVPHAQIQSLDITDTDYSDLAPFLLTMTGKKVISLGESSHGSGTDFRLKTRLVRALHQENQANVIAFESGLYDGLRVWHRYSNHEINNIRDGILYSFFYMYPESAEIFPLYRYVEQQAFTDKPLYFVGFDGRHTSDPACADMLNELRDYYQLHGQETIDWHNFIAGGNRMMCPWYYEKSPITSTQKAVFLRDLAKLEQDLTRLKAQQVLPDLAQRGDFREYATFWRQIVRSLSAQSKAVFNDINDPNERMQAENTLWLQREWFAGETIMTWGHNVHTTGYVGAWPNTRGGMGYVKDVLGDAAYSTAFISYQGTDRFHNADPKKRIEYQFISADNSMEGVLAKKGYKWAFVDLAQVEPSNSYYEFMGTDYNISRKYADGVFFIRDAKACTVDSPRK